MATKQNTQLRDGRTRVALTVAGSDSGGGAGIQADLKTFHQFGVYGTSVITATTAQNTQGVTDVHVVPTDHVAAQLQALAVDLPPHATKAGMLATAAVVETLGDALERFGWGPFVLDPVMIATSGDRLLDPDAEAAISRRLVPLAALVTPNALEAAALTGLDVASVDDLEAAGRALLQMGAGAALVKGGHVGAVDEAGRDVVVDALVVPEGSITLTRPRIDSRHTHGTGCTLAAAVTAGLALDMPLEAAVRTAVDFVWRAVNEAPELGSGNGPINHFVSPGAHDDDA